MSTMQVVAVINVWNEHAREDDVPVVRQADALAAIKAARVQALEEAAKVPREYAMKLDKGGWGNRFPDELTAIFNASTNMADAIRRLGEEAEPA